MAENNTPEEDESRRDVREIRINPIVPSESVLISTARSNRPRKKEIPVPLDKRLHVETCPFCTGNEHKTPETIYAWPSEEHWSIRIVENLYPMLGNDEVRSNLNMGLQQIIDGYGRHEVIIDHHSHGIAIHEMQTPHIAAMFSAYRQRMQILYEVDDRLRYILVFKNFGPAAGASIAHTHSQMIGLPVVPHNVQEEITQSHIFYEEHKCCVWCSLIDEALTFETRIYDRETGEIIRELDVDQFVIERSEKFIAIKPFASRYEWEVHIMPVNHQSDYLEVTEEDLADLAQVIKNTMARLDVVVEGVQYNYFLHTRPHGEAFDNTANSFHWHLEICPRTSIPSGFELGSGLSVNTISPERAAQRLRDINLESDK